MLMSSITGIVGGLVEGVTDIILVGQQRKLAYQQWINSAVPTYTDAFAAYKSEQTQDNLIIIGVLTFLIVVLILALIFK